jgi:hypothetical protein
MRQAIIPLVKNWPWLVLAVLALVGAYVLTRDTDAETIVVGALLVLSGVFIGFAGKAQVGDDQEVELYEE